MTSYTLATALGPKTIDGKRIASSRTSNFPRWIEFELYRLDDGTYASYRVGNSAVYHGKDTACKKKVGQAGEPATVDDLPENAVPCRLCQPMSRGLLEFEAAEGRQWEIRWETPRITLDFFPTALDVAKRLSTNKGSIIVSAPVLELLVQARGNDPAFLDVEIERYLLAG